jgi:hypothetical protein
MANLYESKGRKAKGLRHFLFCYDSWVTEGENINEKVIK